MYDCDLFSDEHLGLIFSRTGCCSRSKSDEYMYFSLVWSGMIVLDQLWVMCDEWAKVVAASRVMSRLV